MSAMPARARAGEVYDRFGGGIAGDGDRVAVAASHADRDGFDAGAVETFVLSDGTWRFEQRVMPDEPLPFGHLGVSVALAGDLLAAGAEPDRGQGATHVFALAGGRWSEGGCRMGQAGAPAGLVVLLAWRRRP